MLVEDDNNLREIYEARLSAEGYEIISASDGESALALAIKEKPDLMISDIMMPNVSGFDMLDILRTTAELKDTKIIMMTALNQAEDKAKAENLGADLYLVKSQVTLEDVVRSVKSLLGEETPLSIGGLPVHAPPAQNDNPVINTSPVTATSTPTSSTEPAQTVASPQAPPDPQTNSSTTQASTTTATDTPNPDQSTTPDPQQSQSLTTKDQEEALQQQIQQYINEELANPSTPQSSPTEATPTSNSTPLAESPAQQQSNFAQPPSSLPANTPANDGDPNEDTPAGQQVIAKNNDNLTSTSQEPTTDASLSGRNKVISPINKNLTSSSSITELPNIDEVPDVPAPEFNTVVTPDGATLSANTTPVAPAPDPNPSPAPQQQPATPIDTSPAINPTQAPLQTQPSNQQQPQIINDIAPQTPSQPPAPQPQPATPIDTSPAINPPLVNDVIAPNQQQTAQLAPGQSPPPPVA